MIEQTLGVADGSCGKVRRKRESLISNGAADEAVDADKEPNRRNAVADKELNAAADEAVDADKGPKGPNDKADEARRFDMSRINS